MITPAQCRAARALIGWPLAALAEAAGLGAEAIARFEDGRGGLGDDEKRRLEAALSAGGAVLVAEGDGMGLGVRLKFTLKDAKQIARLEGEGGAVGEDDVL